MRRRPWTVGTALGVLLFVLFGAWSLASPIGSVPDEYQHYKWGYAMWTGQVDLSTSSNEYAIPFVLAAPRQDCYTFKPDVTPACDILGIAPVADREKVVQVGTSAQWYPPTFYALTGWTLRVWPDERGVYIGRLVNSAFVAALLGWCFGLLVRARRPMVTVGLLFTVSPMLAFFAGGYNPQALEIASAAGFVVGSLLVRGRSGGPAALSLAAVSALVLSTVRPQSYFWTILLLVGVTVAVDRWPRRLWSAVRRRPAPLPRSPRVRLLVRWLTAAAVAAVALGWLWSRIIPLLPPPPASTTVGRLREAVLYALYRVNEYPLEWVGKLGHLDTPAPGLAVAAWWGALGALLLAGWSTRHRRVVIVSVAAMISTVVLSVLMEARHQLSTDGVLIQGRYVLPIVALSVLLAAWVARDNLPPRVRPWVRWMAAVWVLVQTWTFWEALRRNMFGLTESPLVPASWNPPVSLWVLVPTVLVTSLLAVVALDRWSWRRLT